MNEISAKHKWWKPLVWIFTVFTIYILFCALQAGFRNLYSEQSKPWTDIFSLQIVWGYSWAALTPFIVWLSRRYSISRRHFARNLLLHLGFGIVFASVHRALYILFVPLIAPNALTIPNDDLPRVFYFLYLISESFLDYSFILAVVQAIIYYGEFQKREFRLQQAELQTLKTQLHPHFLFNTLNAISALIYSNPKMADRTLAQLSNLLRLSIKSGKTQEVSLKEELDFLRKYVEIQQTLLQERLQVQWNIDSEALDARLPNMILQPLVENSIRHGIAPKKGGVVGVTWFDRRNDPAGKCYDLFFAASLDGGKTFQPEVRVTSKSSCPDTPPNKGAVQRWSYGGDYNGLVAASDGTFQALWTDGRADVFQLRTAQIKVSHETKKKE